MYIIITTNNLLTSIYHARHKYRLYHVYSTDFTCLLMHILTRHHFITSNFLHIIGCPKRKKKFIISPNLSYSSYMIQQMQNLSRSRMIVCTHTNSVVLSSLIQIKQPVSNTSYYIFFTKIISI